MSFIDWEGAIIITLSLKWLEEELPLVSSIVQEVCSVLVEYLWTENISSNMPKSREDFEEKILDMEKLWQFPCCRVALDATYP